MISSLSFVAALGQVMLYVDGMNGVMEHSQTVQWLYTLIASRFRLVVKTALKLLLVFVEYIESNSLLLVRAVRSVDTSRGMIPWTNIMKLLKDYDAADTELLIYATTLVNKCLNGIPDQDTYYDQVDCLEEQGVEGIIQRYMSKQGTDLDLLRQFQIYEAVLHHEDGDDRGTPIRQLDDNIRLVGHSCVYSLYRVGLEVVIDFRLISEKLSATGSRWWIHTNDESRGGTRPALHHSRCL